MVERRNPAERSRCPECLDQAPADRRGFLRWTGGLALAGAAGLAAEDAPAIVPETVAQELYAALSAEQRGKLCLPWSDPRRTKANANWKIVESAIKQLEKTQQAMVEKLFSGLVSESGRGMFKKQMQDDAGGLGNYHLAFFGAPGSKEGFETVITGRHMTMRADGNTQDGVAWGGTMVYGHQAGPNDEEGPSHDGNVFWHQAKAANAVFAALDGKQRAKALRPKAPAEAAVKHRTTGYEGIAGAELSPDQRQLVAAAVRSLLSPYRPADADEAAAALQANGGVEKLNLSFYKDQDLGGDGVWDIWRLEGPGFVWHFRGAPHVHVWVNIAKIS